jgi:poly-gamma-glutamate system protein
VEFIRAREEQPFYQQKLRAAQLAYEGILVIREERFESGYEIDPELDPAGTGLIGPPMSSVTTVTGSLSAKQTSVNPNFAAVVLDMLKEAEVKKGDVVAVGCSGSFPALNICVYAAMRELQLRPIIITSISASQFGANDPDFLWIDMERILHEYNKSKFPYRTIAVSFGGVEDKALGMSKEGRRALTAAIERNGLSSALIEPRDFQDSIEKRMGIYARHAGAADIEAYINIGGGTISVGTAAGKKMLRPGVNLHKPLGTPYADSVMTRFINRGIPVIHLTHIARLAERYGLPVRPLTLPEPGEGLVIFRSVYNPWLAAGVLFVILVSLYTFVRSDIGYRLLQAGAPRKASQDQGPMV